MTEIRLEGCSIEPWLNYLKALGILRLISEQKDEEARGKWEKDSFILSSKLEKKELINFFLEEYMPSPVVAPWNGGSGFFGKKAQEYLEEIEHSEFPRFNLYRETIRECKKVLFEWGLDKKPSDKIKKLLPSEFRKRLPDQAITALDTLLILVDEQKKDSRAFNPNFAPIFGSGGNDGNLEFTNTFIRYLTLCLPTETGSMSKKEQDISRERLRKSLFGVGSVPLEKAPVGQFLPGGIGGPNSSQGFGGESLVNPWDFILGVEGILLFSGSATRRLSDQYLAGRAAFPFTVEGTAAGWGSLGNEEVDRESRGELWFPIWESPASYRELKYLFSEGKMQVGRKIATTGVDAARAMASLGVDRGLKSFRRVGILSGGRNGLNYMGVSLGEFPVALKPEVGLIDEIDWWVNRLRSQIRGAILPGQFRGNLRLIEEGILNYCKYGGRKNLQSILIALGKTSQAIGGSLQVREKIPPLMLSTNWFTALDDDSTEFKIAASVASITGVKNSPIGSIRENVEPVTWDKNKYKWVEKPGIIRENNIEKLFSRILMERIIQADKHNLAELPIKGRVATSPKDIHNFIQGNLDFGKIYDLFQGLVLINWYQTIEPYPKWICENTPNLSRSFALLKLLFLPEPLPEGVGLEPIQVKWEASIIPNLRQKNLPVAHKIALRRIQGSGLKPLINYDDISQFLLGEGFYERLAGSLLIPLNKNRISWLADLVLEPAEVQT